MDWSAIIVAALTGGCAALGQWFVNRKKTREEEVKSALREQQQIDKLDSLYKKLETIDKRLSNSEDKTAQIEAKIAQISRGLEDNNLRTLRLDLMRAMEADPDNQIVILDLARKYFLEMKGNCYASHVVQKWADEHNVNITSIFNN